MMDSIEVFLLNNYIKILFSFLETENYKKKILVWSLRVENTYGFVTLFNPLHHLVYIISELIKNMIIYRFDRYHIDNWMKEYIGDTFWSL